MRFKSMALAAVIASTAGMSALADSGKTIKISVNEWTGQHVSTHIAGETLKKAGYKVEYVTAGYDSQFTAIADGDIHATMEIWSSNAPDLWKKISDYAAQSFPNTGLAFADVHAALAHAMAGNSDALEKVIVDAKGPAGEVVAKMAEAYRSFARQDWADVIARLSPTMSEHERIGGSRAQRDLIEFTYLNALLKLDRADEAERMLLMRRPTKVAGHPIHGLH